MKSGIVVGNEVIKDLYQLINDKERKKNISVLTLEQTNDYIDAALAEQNDLNRIINTVAQVYAPTLEHGSYSSSHSPHWFSYKTTFKYEGHQIKMQYEHGGMEISITPKPPFQQLKECLLELNQHKRNILGRKNLSRELRETTFRDKFFAHIKSISGQKPDALFESKEELVDSEGVSIKEAEQKVALEVLGCFEDLSDKHRKLVEENEQIKKELIERENVTRQVLQQNERLVELSKEKKNQDAKLTYLAEIPQVSTVSRETLLQILQSFDKQTNGSFSFFQTSNKTLSNLSALSKENREIISIEDLTKCIEPFYMKFFNDPLSNYPLLGSSKTASIVHALALEMRRPSQKLAPAC